jgi:uncharacterized surface protein with fasciclin (FAS1) repeats
MKFFQNSLLAITALCTIAFSSCEKNDVASLTPNPSLSILDKVSADANFSLFKEAATKALLLDTLTKTPAAYTVFAPDNAAFTAAGLTSSAIAASTPAAVKTILQYHIISGVVTFAANIATATNTKVIMSNGDSAFFTKKANGNVFVNGVQVTLADIGAVNGVAHKVGRVIRPATGNIVATAQASTGVLDSLVKALQRVNAASITLGGDSSLIPTLSNTMLTVFAPTNAAFTQLLTDLSLTNINQIPLATLKAVLKFHIVNGRNFSSELANGNITMLAGGSTTVNLTNGTGGGPSIKGNGNGTNLCNITATDIMCRNGVVHLIDRVLQP